MYNYGIGGNEVKVDASEAISDISNNKTLLVQKLTVKDELKPEAIYDLKSIEDVFKHFNPKQSVDFCTINGSVKSEEFQFSNLGDFAVKSIIEKSRFLADLNLDADQYTKIAKQLKSNKVLQSVIADSEANKALIAALASLLNELNSQD